MLMKSCHKCFKPRRNGFKKKKSVRGSIVAQDIKMLQLTVVVAGETPIPGLTDVHAEKRLGPKRANKLRKFYGANKNADATKLIIRRAVERNGKTYWKAPKVQRLITHARLQRKKRLRRNKIER